MNRLLTILCVSLLLVSCKTQPIQHGIPNFAQVSPGIYRGGQPDTNGLEYLRSIGVSNIIKLNLESEGPGWKSEDWAMGTQNGVMSEGIVTARVTDFQGFAVSYLPITLKEQLIGPVTWPAHAVRQMQARLGTFVHCEHGQDRTGLIVALYRVKVNGWNKVAAEKEMLAHGFHKELHGLWEYWETFPNQPIWKQW